MKQLLQVRAAERRAALHQQKEREVQERDARGQLRRVAAAGPNRDRKPSDLHQKPQAPVKRQLGHSVASEEESAKPLLRRRDNNQSRLDREFETLTISPAV